MRGGVFSCRARSRPNQTNVSMMGFVCTLMNHRPTIIGGPGLKNLYAYFRCRIDLSIGVHIAPRRIHGRFPEAGLLGAAGLGKAQGGVVLGH